MPVFSTAELPARPRPKPRGAARPRPKAPSRKPKPTTAKKRAPARKPAVPQARIVTAAAVRAVFPALRQAAKAIAEAQRLLDTF